MPTPPAPPAVLHFTICSPDGKSTAFSADPTECIGDLLLRFGVETSTDVSSSALFRTGNQHPLRSRSSVSSCFVEQGCALFLLQVRNT